MELIIAEKPSLAKSIAAALGAGQRKDGYLEGPQYIVSWCFGHLYELYDLEKYRDPKHKKSDKVRWTLECLPFYPENWNFQYEIKEDAGVRKQVRILKELMNRKDVDTIFAAGDADREGEVIVRLVLEHNLKPGKKIRRLWLPALTPDAIREGVRIAKPDSCYDDLYRAGKARAGVDWIMGIDLTRYASIKAHTSINIGRCICPIVSKVVLREKEIREFVPKRYLAVVSKEETAGCEMELRSEKEFSPGDRKNAEEAASAFNHAGARVTDIHAGKKVIKSGKLFSMSDLQSFICKQHREMTPSNVLDAVQSLYEKAYVTYPRTSSNYLAAGESGRIDGIIAVLLKAGYQRICNKSGNRDIYDDTRVESHSGLTPTNRLPDNLSGSEKIAYDAILGRFLAVFCAEDCIVEHTDVKITCSGEDFRITGDVIRQEGWRKYEPSGKKDRLLPPLAIGDPVNVLFKVLEKETEPPKRYTVETLNAWMKAPMRGENRNESEYSDAEWKDILSEATICTEATRAATIDKCIANGYIALRNGVYSALEKGFFMTDVLQDLSIDLSERTTAELSKNLHDISEGRTAPETVYKKTQEMIDAVFAKNAQVHSTYTEQTQKGGRSRWKK